jgi:hypothetical protein
MQNSQKPSRSAVHQNWRDFQESALEDQKLQRRLVAKSLDVPYGVFDEMRDIQVNKGLSGIAVAALSAALLVGGIGGGLGLMSLLNRPQPAATGATGDSGKPPIVKTEVIEKTTTIDNSTAEKWKLGAPVVIPPRE